MAVMSNKCVAHVVRKVLPPTVSFIKNQIACHIRYTPCIVFKEYIKSNLAKELNSSFSYFYCEEKKQGFKKVFSYFLYKYFRKLTSEDIENSISFIRKNNASVLHFHYGTDARVFCEIVKKLRIPSVVSFYGYDCSSFPQRYFGYGRRYLQKMFKTVDYCIAMSDDMKEDLLGLGCPGNKIIVHYSGFESDRFYFKRNYTDNNKIILLITSALEEKKGHLFLLQALKKAISQTKTALQLRIVGSGPMENKLKAYITENRLEKYVFFTGRLEYLSEEFLKEFQNADIFVHPSITCKTQEKEGIPGAIAEAMATGIPIISTFHAGIPAIIQHESTGYLVEEWDIDTLANYICLLAEDVNERRKIGQNAQYFALHFLDIKNKEDELEQIYDFAINQYNRKNGEKTEIFTPKLIL
ncbi:MAG: hypothetical protein A2Y62_02725 [Candidatus Fischerbacteria bacterium RBG_13_37_8]|uniref:Glycosyl transferase family 1 domain-containing protein n=1 Tax=Candidatus Fischerbacteria bacterium RBG_13_37_8 TaxID=1817863 RepID=A0A1F5VXX5_9BACT|nr:MAG: hypothetical protein A2Y62_02725 [Candidatus Fischerbacteria bacterium RBG_13_37_8]